MLKKKKKMMMMMMMRFNDTDIWTTVGQDSPEMTFSSAEESYRQTDRQT